MFGIGPEELVLVLIVALLVLGPERLPRVARDVGRVVGELRRTSDEFREEFMNADKLLEGRAPNAPTPVAEAAPPAIPATTQTPSDPNESAFDREMREARERLAASKEKPAT
jgi:Tat protein translocase TatB subunit